MMRYKETRSLPVVGGLTSRREVLRRGAIVAAVSAIAPVWSRRARAQTASTTFDYYISTNGSDSNPGTLASPWAITSLQTSSSHYSMMKGKRIGLLPGVYPVYALWGSRTAPTDPLLSVPSGTSSAWTYLGSSDSSGKYSPRTAHITASPSKTPGGGLPGSASDQRSIIGQSYSDAGGYMEIDGIIVSDGITWGIYVGGPYGGIGGPPFIIQNCEVYNIGGTEGSNVGGIQHYSTTGTIIRNNKIHDVTVSSGGSDGHNFAGIFGQDSLDVICEYNTIYNCNCGIYHKNANNGGHTYRYNYIELNGSSPYNCLMDCAGGRAGQTLTVHNNIFVIAGGSGSERNIFRGICSASPPGYNPYQNVSFYNNTSFVLSGGSFQGGVTYQSAGLRSVTHYNNIYVSGAPGYMGTTSFNSGVGVVAISDYNAYVGGCAGYLGKGTDGAAESIYTLSSWQSNFSLDAHSIAPTASELGFTNPGLALTPDGYQLQSGSACKGAGRSNGTAAGAALDMGAWGGTDVNTGGPISQIGSNFAASGSSGSTTSPPAAPVLTVS